MQFDHQRAFPHPVLRPDVDDYTDGDFQVTVDFRPDDLDLAILANFHYALSVPEIEHEIQAARASFAVVVSCRETYYREVLYGQDHSIEYLFPGGSLRGEVLANSYIVCSRKIDCFSCKLVNEEFGPGPFSFEPGAVLALDEPKAIYVDRDVFKPITSIFELVMDQNITGSEWRLRFNQNKVSIALGPKLKEKVDIARSSSTNKAILINSVYFAAVMQCVRNLRDGSDYDDYRWAHVVRQQCHNLGIDMDAAEEYLIAERLMKFPVGLLEAYVFGDRRE
jgi:hypothetical protein